MKYALSLLFALLVLSGCRPKEASQPHSHGDEHPHGHDHHAEGHGHGGANVEGFTIWSERYELFGELSRGGHHGSQLLLHFTRLEDFSALSGLPVELEYKAQSSETKRVSLQEKQPGIFAGSVDLGEEQPFQTKVLVDGKVIWWPKEDSDLLVVGKSGQGPHDHAHEGEAHPDDDHPGPHEDHHDHGEIELLKEQQWSIPFATAAVKRSSLEPTKEVLGHVEFPPSSTAQVSAPLSGKILPPAGGFPNPGQSVKAGEILARIAPTVKSADQLAQLNLGVAQAKSKVQGTQSELARQKRLAAQGATSQRALEQAQRDHDQAQQALTAAQASQRIYKSGAQNSIPVRSPISGILTNLNVRIGELAATGQVMFRVSNTQSTWLVTHIPVQWMPQLQQRGPISVFDDATRKWKRYNVASDEGQATQASLLNVAVQADRNTQVVDVLYAIHETQGRWLEGAAKRILVPIGAPQSGFVIPRSAVVHEKGVDRVYVQVDGEHFVARTVRLELQQGDEVLIKHGLEPHERVVTQGGSVISLASKADTPMGHGHLH